MGGWVLIRYLVGEGMDEETEWKAFSELMVDLWAEV